MLKPIIKVLSDWQNGQLHSLKWLSERGLDRLAVHRSCEKEELKRVGDGVFKRIGDPLHWAAAVEIMQGEFQKSVHVGGLSALEIHGASHNLRMRNTSIDLFTYENWNIPTWIKRNDFGVAIRLHKSRLFEDKVFLDKKEIATFQLFISSRETAILEYISTLKFESDFENLENIMLGLGSLRSDYLQQLLERCKSFRVKKIFLYLADSLRLPFFKRLDLSKIDLGKDFSIVIKGGKRDARYKLTVPRIEEESPF